MAIVKGVRVSGRSYLYTDTSKAVVHHLFSPQFKHITEIRVEDLHIPLFTDVYHGIKNSYSKFIEPFRFDETKFPPKTNQLTATFSRDKEYL